MSVGAFVVLLAALPAGPAAVAAPAPALSPADEKTLKDANLTVSGAGLL